MRPASCAVISMNSFSRSPRSAEISSELRCHTRSRVNASSRLPPRDLPARVRREAGNAVGARRYRDVRVDLALEGFQFDLFPRAGLSRTQPRTRMLGSEHHGVIADLGVELHLEELTGGRGAPQA